MGGTIKVVEIALPRPPSVNRLWRMGNGRMFKSAEYTAWIAKCFQSIQGAKVPSVLGKYKLMIRVARPDKRRRDIDNYIKAVSDFLQSAKIIQDDSLCEAVYCKWVEGGPEMLINVYPVRGHHELSGRPEKPLQRSSQKNEDGGIPAQSPREQLAAAYAAARRRGIKGAGKASGLGEPSD